MSRAFFTLLAGAVVATSGCTDQSQIVQPRRALEASTTSRNTIPGYDHICGDPYASFDQLIYGSPSSVSLYVGQSATIQAVVPLCLDSDGSQLLGSNGVADFSGDGTVASAGAFQASSVTVHALSDGDGWVSLSSCCDELGNDAWGTVAVHVTHPPLATHVTGAASAITGNECMYSSGVTGGYPPYTFSWGVDDGTIIGGSTGSSVDLRFNSDGSHLVAVEVTDSHSQRASGGITVESSAPTGRTIECGNGG